MIDKQTKTMQCNLNKSKQNKMAMCLGGSDMATQKSGQGRASMTATHEEGP